MQGCVTLFLLSALKIYLLGHVELVLHVQQLVLGVREVGLQLQLVLGVDLRGRGHLGLHGGQGGGQLGRE